MKKSSGYRCACREECVPAGRVSPSGFRVPAFAGMTSIFLGFSESLLYSMGRLWLGRVRERACGEGRGTRAKAARRISETSGGSRGQSPNRRRSATARILARMRASLALPERTRDAESFLSEPARLLDLLS